MIACQNDDMAIGARRALEEISNLQERDSLLNLPIIGCDGLPRSGQAWVRQKRLAATVVSPPIMGNALELLDSALQKGSQPPERTVVSPSSFPTLKELKDSYKRADGASASS
jgi:ribose transport system substrate-binding protein